MNIILVPEGIRKGGIACLTHRHLLVWAFVGLGVLPAVLGWTGLRIYQLVERQSGAAQVLATQQRALATQQAAIAAARSEAATHLNALALRLGQLQAQVLRLNALGTRLTAMAGLDAREFNFAAEVAQGGPEAAGTEYAPDVLGSLNRLDHEIDQSRARLQALESLLLDRKLSAQVTPAGWPAQGGWVSSGFGLRTDPFNGRQAYHEGVDIASRLGSPVKAMGDGVVTHAGEKAGYGLLVELTHESGLITRYAHLTATLVKVGDKVTRDAEIATVGTSGRSTGPHLHFEVVKDGRPVNPGAYLNFAQR
jgi:murein DD-endopeptidase MepM/ murein hydrolase activator NlpD